jgi:hypothetical protein
MTLFIRKAERTASVAAVRGHAIRGCTLNPCSASSFFAAATRLRPTASLVAEFVVG